MTQQEDTLELGSFRAWPKIARLNREMVITEKIDGTNACVCVNEQGDVWAQSRTRVITPADDNFGFASWVENNYDLLAELGPGRHYGEWWGSGVQRGYGLPQGEKRFSLFNTHRWTSPLNAGEGRDAGTECLEVPVCDVVPVMYEGAFSQHVINEALGVLTSMGSWAASGYFPPEGVVVYHTAARQLFKVTLGGDAK